MEYSSKLLENAVAQIAQLPGIGSRTATRLALDLLRKPKEKTISLAQALLRLRQDIIFCNQCHNISDKHICDICSNSKRDNQTVCVVENIKDVIAIESTKYYRGVYHVLGGLISPVEGFGPEELNINSLIDKTKNNRLKEIIFALSATMEADTTNYYLYKLLEPFDIKVSTIARGISLGEELEHTDQMTLGRSIASRVPFTNTIKSTV